MENNSAFQCISPRARLAVAALLMLAQLTRQSPKPVTLAQLAAALPGKPSVSTLELLFAKLRHAGLIDSVRGATGGFQIPHPLTTISVAAVVHAVSVPAKNIPADATTPLWQRVASTTEALLTTITLHQVQSGQL